MAFSPNMQASARRHLEAANKLKSGTRKDVAGYLYGISAECAIKAMMIDIGMRPKAERRDDPFYMHFPALRTALLDSLQGRSAAPLNNLISSGAFLSNWSTEMRYCKGDEIQDAWVNKWEEQARQAVSSIGT